MKKTAQPRRIQYIDAAILRAGKPPKVLDEGKAFRTSLLYELSRFTITGIVIKGQSFESDRFHTHP